MKSKRSVYYATIQVREDVKKQISDYCDRNGLKIGRYIEILFLNHVSGSNVKV